MKQLIQNALNKFGYEVYRKDGKRTGIDPLRDMRRFLQTDAPIVFDIGANVGQTIERFKREFPASKIYSFEPGADTFKQLQRTAKGKPNVHLYNYALGAERGQLKLLENTNSDMSSFLPLGAAGWGEIRQESTVDVLTVDEFCCSSNVERIDILKSDTQGFEMEVLKGARGRIKAGQIGLVYFEVTFSDMYEGLPSFGALFDFLRGNGFRFVTTYDIHYQDDLAGWTDALFVHQNYLRDSHQSL